MKAIVQIGTAQSRQRAKLLLLSSELGTGLPQPLTRRRVCPPIWFWGKGHTRWREWGWESPNSDEGTYTVVLFIYMYFVTYGDTGSVVYMATRRKAVIFASKCTMSHLHECLRSHTHNNSWPACTCMHAITLHETPWYFAELHEISREFTVFRNFKGFSRVSRNFYTFREMIGISRHFHEISPDGISMIFTGFFTVFQEFPGIFTEFYEISRIFTGFHESRHF